MLQPTCAYLRERHIDTTTRLQGCKVCYKSNWNGLTCCIFQFHFSLSQSSPDMRAGRNNLLERSSAGRKTESRSASCDLFQRRIFCNKFILAVVMNHQVKSAFRLVLPQLCLPQFFYSSKEEIKRLRSKSFTVLDFYFIPPAT